MTTTLEWPLASALIALAVPSLLALTALATPRLLSPRRACGASVASLVLTVVLVVGAALSHGPTANVPLAGVCVSAVTSAMLLLVCSIGVVIARYSMTYLEGEPRLASYLRWLMLTLSAVTSVVIANNLLVMVVAWTATGLALHQLLTFYPDRTAALVAAHKKFLVSRLADLSLLVSVVLVHANTGSLDLDRIATWADHHPELTPSMHLAAVLVVVAVALRSAQLPFHGWLIQVMESPTPVSALLHAGIVNIGGFVLIRLAPWMVHARPAQYLLVIIGLVSAILAALVTTTRVSVKVALAWSTCAQMGFMLVECGLGAWHLALLHLLAHSLYKAHAFLRSGSAVEGWRVQALLESPTVPSTRRFAVACVLASSGAMLFVLFVRAAFPGEASNGPSLPVLSVLLGLSSVPLLASGLARGGATTAVIAARVGVVAVLYLGWHVAAAHLLPSHPQAASGGAWLLVGAALVSLFAVKATLALLPRGRVARALYPWLYAGLYLDEGFTRLTFHVWPPRLRPRPKPRMDHVRAPVEVEA